MKLRCKIVLVTLVLELDKNGGKIPLGKSNALLMAEVISCHGVGSAFGPASLVEVVEDKNGGKIPAGKSIRVLFPIGVIYSFAGKLALTFPFSKTGRVITGGNSVLTSSVTSVLKDLTCETELNSEKVVGGDVPEMVGSNIQFDSGEVNGLEEVSGLDETISLLVLKTELIFELLWACKMMLVMLYSQVTPKCLFCICDKKLGN